MAKRQKLSSSHVSAVNDQVASFAAQAASGELTPDEKAMLKEAGLDPDEMRMEDARNTVTEEAADLGEANTGEGESVKKSGRKANKAPVQLRAKPNVPRAAIIDDLSAYLISHGMDPVEARQLVGEAMNDTAKGRRLAKMLIGKADPFKHEGAKAFLRLAGDPTLETISPSAWDDLLTSMARTGRSGLDPAEVAAVVYGHNTPFVDPLKGPARAVEALHARLFDRLKRAGFEDLRESPVGDAMRVYVDQVVGHYTRKGEPITYKTATKIQNDVISLLQEQSGKASARIAGETKPFGDLLRQRLTGIYNPQEAVQSLHGSAGLKVLNANKGGEAVRGYFRSQLGQAMQLARSQDIAAGSTSHIPEVDNIAEYLNEYEMEAAKRGAPRLPPGIGTVEDVASTASGKNYPLALRGNFFGNVGEAAAEAAPSLGRRALQGLGTAGKWAAGAFAVDAGLMGYRALSRKLYGTEVDALKRQVEYDRQIMGGPEEKAKRIFNEQQMGRNLEAIQRNDAQPGFDTSGGGQGQNLAPGSSIL